MDNIIKFERSNTNVEIDEVGEKAWSVMSDYIDLDFSNSGITPFADRFKAEFKPIFEELFIGPIALPLIHEDDPNPLHQEWREGLIDLRIRIQERTKKLVNSTYEREVYRFCERHFS